MLRYVGIDKKLAIFLAECCNQAYNQYHNDGYFDVPRGYRLVEGFQATAFGITEWFGFILQSTSSIVVAFRGTGSEPDWIANAAMFQTTYPYYLNSKTKIHAGFRSIYKSCRNQIINTLKKLPTTSSLYVTGHSLGGALATLHALDAAANTNFLQLIMYNYACPRVGDPYFASAYDGLVKTSTRIVNIHDIVPLIPPKKIKSPFSKKGLVLSTRAKQVFNRCANRQHQW